MGCCWQNFGERIFNLSIPTSPSVSNVPCLSFLGESAVASAMLTQSFRNYISVDEKCLIEKCLASDMKWDDEDEMSQLLEVFSNYNCRIMVNSENVSQVI